MTKLDGVNLITPIRGSLALHRIYLWPNWYKSKNKILFSYKRDDRLHQVFIENKTYTFEDIQNLVKKHLDINNKNNQASIFYKNGKVTLMVNIKNDSTYPIHNIQFCEELLNMLKLPKKDDCTGVIPEEPVDLYDLTFNDNDLLYLRCHEIDESNILENSITSNLIAVIPFEYNNKLISYRDPNPLFYSVTPRKMVYSLHFSFEDSKGNAFPVNRFALTILNK